MAKTKVSPPTKAASITRMELCGAHLLSNMIAHYRPLLDIAIEDSYAWIDSSIALSWIVTLPQNVHGQPGSRPNNQDTTRLMEIRAHS